MPKGRHYNPCKEIKLDSRTILEREVDDEFEKMVKEIDERLATEFFDKPVELIGS